MRERKMKRILLTLCVFIVFITSAYAEGLYDCIDRNGNPIITSSPQDGMKCAPKESDGDSSLDEQAGKEYIYQQKAITDQQKARAERERAIADQERTIADRQRRIEEKQRYKDKDIFCDKNCTTTFNSCTSDCDWNKKHADVNRCKDRCDRAKESCLNRCDR